MVYCGLAVYLLEGYFHYLAGFLFVFIGTGEFLPIGIVAGTDVKLESLSLERPVDRFQYEIYGLLDSLIVDHG